MAALTPKASRLSIGLSGNELYPVADNSDLIAFLREQTAKNRVSIMMHGYSHVDEPDGYEFETAADLERKAREGKQYLEDGVWSSDPCLRPAQ